MSFREKTAWITLIALMLVSFIVLRVRHPRASREPRDERERLLDLKAVRIAHHVFTALALGGVFVALHVIATGPVGVAMVVFIAFVVSQMVKHMARIVYYRKG